MKFINDQYEKYLQEEVNINRKKRIPDTRVHCCLYFIPATGHAYVPGRGAGGSGQQPAAPTLRPHPPSALHLAGEGPAGLAGGASPRLCS